MDGEYIEGDYTPVTAMGARVTASKVGLLQQCGYFARPEAEWNHTTSEAAARGTQFHKAIAWYVETGEGDDSDLEDLVAVAAKWVDSFGRERLAAEVAFAWDPATDTAQRIEAVDRNYAAWPNHLCGTADLVAVNRMLKVGYVGDWSTGDGTRKGPQLRTLALALARAEGLESVTVEGLEVSEEGVRSVCREDLDASALDEIAGELAELLAGVPEAAPTPGEWCSQLYCPARVECPASREIVSQVIPAANLVKHRWGLAIQSPDHAAWLLAQVKLVGAAVEDVKEAIKAYVPKDGLVLEDGSLLVEGVRNMPRTDNVRVLMLARTLGATDEQIEACKYVAVESAGLKIKKPTKAKRGKAA